MNFGCGRLSLLNHEQERREGIRQTIGRHEVAAFKIMLASRHPGHVARLEMFAREPRAGWDIWGKEIYQPRLFPGFYAVAEARARILQRLAELPDGGSLAALLPETGGATRSELRRRSAWSSTLAASLESAKQGDVKLARDADFQPIHVARA
jgi:hypothetical protein